MVCETTRGMLTVGHKLVKVLGDLLGDHIWPAFLVAAAGQQRQEHRLRHGRERLQWLLIELAMCDLQSRTTYECSTCVGDATGLLLLGPSQRGCQTTHRFADVVIVDPLRRCLHKVHRLLLKLLRRLGGLQAATQARPSSERHPCCCSYQLQVPARTAPSSLPSTNTSSRLVSASSRKLTRAALHVRHADQEPGTLHFHADMKTRTLPPSAGASGMPHP